MCRPRRIVPAFLVALLLTTGAAVAQPADTSVAVSNDSLLALYEGLRVADVSDGMDVVGRRDVGLMDPRIRPLWRDVETFGHQFVGIAVTARYVPTNRPTPDSMAYEDFQEWAGQWYSEVSPEPFVQHIEEGTAVVIDASGDGDTGSIGSYNALAWVNAGMSGLVTTGSVRDTDEIIAQAIPLYYDPLQRGRGIRPGRNEFESMMEPVEVGGVLVEPGDVVVADGDGVVVVPHDVAVPVARAARTVLEGDRQARRQLYEEMGRPMDETVRPEENGGSEP